jgi:Uma2 family endonuclease
MTASPLAIVEIISPSQSADVLSEKLDAYFEAGAISVWLAQSFAEVFAA